MPPTVRHLLMLLLLGSATACIAAPDQVLLVRHAEKSAEPPGDPALSDAGRQRAEALVDALRGVPVDAVIVTQFRRTRQTAAPVAQHHGITPQVVEAGRGGLQAHVDAVVDAIRAHDGGTLLVVGHSNTLMPIVAALGGPRRADLSESDYGDLFSLRPGDADPALVRSRFGASAEPQ